MSVLSGNILSTFRPVGRSMTSAGTLRRLTRHPGGQMGLALGLALILIALVGPFVVPDPNQTNYGEQLAPISATHPLGTDQAGRDALARAVAGTRTSLGAALLVSLITLGIGLVVGMAAGLAGGLVDAIASRVIDILLGLPSLVVSLAIVGALGPGFDNLILALSATGWAYLARLARSQVLGDAQRPDVITARMAGVSTFRIVVGHILPGVLILLLVGATVALAEVVLALAGLSFLGLGAQPPTAEWGQMLADSRGVLASAPWLMIGPSVGLIATIGSALLLSEALRDVADPSRKS